MANTQKQLSGASSGASVGGAIVPGWGHAIGAAIGAVFGSGGSGTYAVGNGFELRGNITPAGYQGTVIGLASNAGQNYRIDTLANNTGEFRTLNDYIAYYWRELNLPPDLEPIPFNLNSPDTTFADTLTKLGDLLKRVKAEYDKSQTVEQPSTIAESDSSAPSVAPHAPLLNQSQGGYIIDVNWWIIGAAISAVIAVVYFKGK